VAADRVHEDVSADYVDRRGSTILDQEHRGACANSQAGHTLGAATRSFPTWLECGIDGWERPIQAKAAPVGGKNLAKLCC